jgi:D-alanine-D-alanine ligase
VAFGSGSSNLILFEGHSLANKTRVGVIFGGRSGEHEVSVRSARSVIESIDRRKYDVVPIAITKEGKWLSPAETTGLLASYSSSKTDRAVAIIGDPSRSGLVSIDSVKKSFSESPIDVVFPVLHGTYGEDGTIQGLLDMAGIPYVGCGVLASACGMDKVTMKALFRDAGLPICKYSWFLRSKWEMNPQGTLRQVVKEIGFPCFVKPANLGSSVGVSKATDRKSLIAAIGLASQYDRKIIVEEAVNAREIECAVLGNEQVDASLAGEYIVLKEDTDFLDYAEKYSGTGHVEFIVPARISTSMMKRLQSMAIRAFQSIDGSGLARVDFFLDRKTGKLLLNELNTMPGLTDVSGYPKMWAASGLPFPQLIDRLIFLAIERHRDKARVKTSL